MNKTRSFEEGHFRGKAAGGLRNEGTGELLFKEGEFVFGNLIVSGDQRWIAGPIIEWDDEYICHEWWAIVKPETVGERIGLQEHPGAKEIYTGDLVKVTLISSMNGKPIVSETRPVVRKDGMFGIEWGARDIFVPLAQFSPGTKIEIVGDIHTNPELLEV